MAMRSIYREIRGMKVKEIPGYLKPKMTSENAKGFIRKGLDSYHAKYIETSSIYPLLHVVYGGMVFSYLVALPEERRHLAHASSANHY